MTLAVKTGQFVQEMQVIGCRRPGIERSSLAMGELRCHSCRKTVRFRSRNQHIHKYHRAQASGGGASPAFHSFAAASNERRRRLGRELTRQGLGAKAFLWQRNLRFAQATRSLTSKMNRAPVAGGGQKVLWKCRGDSKRSRRWDILRCLTNWTGYPSRLQLLSKDAFERSGITPRIGYSVTDSAACARIGDGPVSVSSREAD